MTMTSGQHLDPTAKPSRWLQALHSLSGIPICRVGDQNLAPFPHLILYPDGDVRVFVNRNVSRRWDPLVPLRAQLEDKVFIKE
jgi:hypothetical protein